jgi:hypothetical protein
MIKEVIVQNGQNLFDIAINEYGDVSYAYEISYLNSIPLDRYPKFGSKILINPDLKGNNNIKSFFRNKKSANFKNNLLNLLDEDLPRVRFQNNDSALFQDDKQVKFQIDE